MFEFILCWHLLISLGSALECGLDTQWDSVGWEWELESTSPPQHWDPVLFEFVQSPTHANTVFLSSYVCLACYICKTCKLGLSVPNLPPSAYCLAVSSCINPHLVQGKAYWTMAEFILHFLCNFGSSLFNMFSNGFQMITNLSPGLQKLLCGSVFIYLINYSTGAYGLR